MLCKNCGAKVEEHSAFCRFCGATLTQPTYQQPYQPNNQYGYQPSQQQTYQPSQAYRPTYEPSQAYPPSYQPGYGPAQPYYGAAPARSYSWVDFYNRFAAKKTKNLVNWETIICFFTAVISLVFMFVTEDMIGIMDIAVYLTTGILLLTQKKSIFAFIPTVYGGIWTVIGMATEGSTTGVAAVAVGVVCMIFLSKVEKAYKEYQANGTLPTEQL